MNKKMKKKLWKIIISAILFALAFVFKAQYELISNVMFTVSYIIVGYDIVIKALKNITRGKVFDENFLMTVATIGAFCIGELPEAAAVMLFYQVGEMFQDYAVDKSRKSVAALMDIRPDYAVVVRDRYAKKVSPDEVKIDEIILVKPGEKIPLDGIVTEGKSTLNTLALTGEALPRSVDVGDEVLSGSINNDGVLKIKVIKEFGESTVSKILDLVENASSKKSKSENFISKFAKYYTPVVVIIAVMLGIFPPLLFKQPFNIWVYRALSFLVVSCPCAIVVSVPLSFFGGIGASSRMGVLVKGSNYLEALSKVEVIVCDKTGTLTEGVFKVQKIVANGVSENELIKYAAYAESFSNHPISLSLKEAYGDKIDDKKVSDVKEISGKGVYAKVEGKEILVGNEKLLKENGIEFPTSNEIGTIVYVAINHEYAGFIVISDKIKEDTYIAIDLFKKNNVKKVVMLTGDKKSISEAVSKELNLDEYHSELLPQDKVEIVERLMKEKAEEGKLLFVGDGINDAPVLALSDIGIAMGGLGSDAAIEAADVVIMTDEPSKIAGAIKISKNTMRIVKENIIIALAVKISVLVLVSIGIATMWSAVFADVGVSMIAVLNALRILKKDKKNQVIQNV